MSYNIEGTFSFEGETFRPGERVIVSSIDYGHDEGIVAGTMSATGGTMLVVDVDGEHVVLAESDIESIVSVQS